MCIRDRNHTLYDTTRSSVPRGKLPPGSLPHFALPTAAAHVLPVQEKSVPERVSVLVLVCVTAATAAAPAAATAASTSAQSSGRSTVISPVRDRTTVAVGRSCGDPSVIAARKAIPELEETKISEQEFSGV